METERPVISVLGCGHGGLALAADFARKGCVVRMGTLSLFRDRLIPFLSQGGIRLREAGSEYLVPISGITAVLPELVDGAAAVFVAVPAYRHALFINALAPVLQNGQFVVFLSHFGALHCRHWLRTLSITTDVTPVELLSLPYAARRLEPGSVTIYATRKRLPAAALPVERTEIFLGRISGALPQAVAAENVLFTSFNNVGPVLLPALTLLNAGSIADNARAEWHLWADGFMPAVARTALAVEGERSAILEMLSIEDASPLNGLAPGSCTDGTGKVLSEAMRSHPLLARRDIPGPGSLNDRFISESVPFGLVPWASIADRFLLSAPTIHTLINLASVVNGRDYMSEGLTIDGLGLDHLSPQKLTRSVS
jgi:opine dehydrogenase